MEVENESKNRDKWRAFSMACAPKGTKGNDVCDVWPSKLVVDLITTYRKHEKNHRNRN